MKYYFRIISYQKTFSSLYSLFFITIVRFLLFIDKYSTGNNIIAIIKNNAMFDFALSVYTNARFSSQHTSHFKLLSVFTPDS